MAPLALSAKVDALSLSDERPLSSTADAPAKSSSPATRVFRCTFPGCGREFQLKGNLKRHSNIHSGDKKFACKFCGKKFLRKADMEVHYRVHTGEKPYRCKYEECGKCFARRSDLLSHERTHTGRKPFACPFPGCERSFARKFDLHKHQRLHEAQPGVPMKPKPKTMKRRLKKEATSDKSDGSSCDCPSDVAAAFDSSLVGSDPALDADVLVSEPKAPVVPLPTGCIGARFKMTPATSACLDTPRPLRYELKCSENHIHSPPACFAALTSMDAFMLSQETLELPRPLGMEAYPHRPSTSVASGCCPAHLELRPPPPEAKDAPAVFTEPDILDQLLTTFPPAIAPNTNSVGLADGISLAATPSATAGLEAQPLPSAVATQSMVAPGDSLAIAPSSVLLNDVVISSTGAVSSPSMKADPLAPATVSVSIASADGTSTALTASCGQKRSAEKACLTTPTSSLFDYSRHKRGCGHLSIQHGNHHDYVVQNHLVCQDSITSLGALQQAGKLKAECKAATSPTQGAVPQDTHKPGCGHLPVRHKDHIDYVVEDNLICQQASWLEDDNLELLGDDFWDFYGAVDAFLPTDK